MSDGGSPQTEVDWKRNGFLTTRRLVTPTRRGDHHCGQFVGHDDARRIGLTRIGLSPYRPVAIDRGQITALHSTLQALAS